MYIIYVYIVYVLSPYISIYIYMEREHTLYMYIVYRTYIYMYIDIYDFSIRMPANKLTE